MPLSNAIRVKNLWFVVAVLLLAATLRIINVSSWPVWTDEGWSIWATHDHRPEVILDRLAHDRHPPLYFLALSAFRSAAGDSRLALRFLSIAAGLLTVAVTYRLAAGVFGHRAGRYAALLLAALPLAVYYAQEVRHYGWFVLLSTLSWLLFLRLLKSPRLAIWLAYVASLTLALYTLYFAVLPLALQIMIGLARTRLEPQRHRGYGDQEVNPQRHRDQTRQTRWLIGAWLAPVMLYVPWLVVIVGIQWPTLTSGIGGFPGTVAATLANLPPLAELLLGRQLALPLALLLLGGWQVVRTPTLAGWTVLLAGIGLAIIMFGLSLRFELLSGRTLVFLTPLLMVVCGYGLSLIQIEPPRRQDKIIEPQRRRGLGDQSETDHFQRVFHIACLLVGVYVLVTLTTPAIIQPRIDSDKVAAVVADDYSPGDLIVLETGWDDNAFAYELERLLPDAEIIRTITRADIYSDEKDLLPAVMPQLQAHRRVWVVQWLQAPQIMNALEAGAEGFRRVISHELPVNADYRQRFGDSTIHMVLYEKPQLTGQSWQFGDLFLLQDALRPTQARPGDRLHVDLWWMALKPLPLDYSVGVFVLDAGGVLRAEHNSPPANLPTTQWQPDDLLFDRHTLTLPADLPPGTYQLVVKVYWYGDNQPLPVNGQPYATLGEIEVR